MINLTIKEMKETHNMDGWNIIDIWIENHIRSDCKVRARSMKPIDVWNEHLNRNNVWQSTFDEYLLQRAALNSIWVEKAHKFRKMLILLHNVIDTIQWFGSVLQRCLSAYKL